MSNRERQASLFGRAGDEPPEEPPKPQRGRDRRQDAGRQSGASALLHRRAEQPLATRMRPVNLEEMVGQSHLLAEGRALRRVIESETGSQNLTINWPESPRIHAGDEWLLVVAEPMCYPACGPVALCQPNSVGGFRDTSFSRVQ